MSNNPWLWRSLRSIIIILLSCFIIYLTILPYSFLTPQVWFSNILYVLIAVMISRRPGSANLLTIGIVTIYYTIYTDEGIALGGAALITMALILHKMRSAYIESGFLIEWLTTSAIYVAIIIIKNIILTFTFTYHFKLEALIKLGLSFVILYPVINAITLLIFKSKNENLEEV